LEPLTATHAEELFPVLSHPAIFTYLDDQSPVSVSALAQRCRLLESRFFPGRFRSNGSNWVIRRAERGDCAGYVQATIYPAGTADLAFVLAPAFWGLGLAHEASIIALCSLFNEFRVSSVLATTDRRNLRSVALLLRLGFQRVPPLSYPHGTPKYSDDVFELRDQRAN
jgi:RimJ/RimL family protein N-acetyltransferase